MSVRFAHSGHQLSKQMWSLTNQFKSKQKPDNAKQISCRALAGSKNTLSNLCHFCSVQYQKHCIKQNTQVHIPKLKWHQIKAKSHTFKSTTSSGLNSLYSGKLSTNQEVYTGNEDLYPQLTAQAMLCVEQTSTEPTCSLEGSNQPQTPTHSNESDIADQDKDKWRCFDNTIMQTTTQDCIRAAYKWGCWECSVQTSTETYYSTAVGTMSWKQGTTICHLISVRMEPGIPKSVCSHL